MKLILDFDDVLFETSRLKEKFFAVLGEHGILRAQEKYHFERANDRPFSLKLFIRRLCKERGVGNQEADSLYDETMSVCSELLNPKLIALIENVGRKNCFLVTNGEEDYQEDKISCSGAAQLVEEVIIVPGTKKFVIESLCRRFPDEAVVFVDDKEKFFEDIDKEQCKNLVTVLYDGNDIEQLEMVLEEADRVVADH